MFRPMKFALISAAMVTASAAVAQNAPPTFQADPDVYKVIFEDQNFRVITGTWKKGAAADRPHSHQLPFVIYAVNDCTLRLRDPDGTTREAHPKAGTAIAGPITASHTAENIGAGDCSVVFVERK